MLKMVTIFMSLLCFAGGIFAQPKISDREEQFAEGRLLTDYGNGVQGAEIFVMDEAGTLLPLMVSTEASGRFSLSGISANQHFIVKPFKDDNPANGLDVWDLYQLRQAVALSNFDSPYQKLAADINDDQVVDDKDIVALNDFILGNPSVLDKAILWHFYDANCLPPMSSPFGACAKTKDFSVSRQEHLDLNFVAIKVGDMNNSAVANNTQKKREHIYGNVLLNTTNQLMQTGHEYEISFHTSDEEMLAYQFSLNLGSLEFVDFVGGDVALEKQVGFHKLENVISFALLESIDSQLFTIKVRATEDARLSDVLSFNAGFAQAISYDEDEKGYALKLSFDGKLLDKLVLFQNEPNPFGDKTNIRFFLPKASKATLTIYDMNGHSVKTIKNSYAAGMNQIAIQKSAFNTSGIYFYKLETNEQSAIRKMVILE